MQSYCLYKFSINAIYFSRIFDKEYFSCAYFFALADSSSALSWGKDNAFNIVSVNDAINSLSGEGVAVALVYLVGASED